MKIKFRKSIIYTLIIITILLTLLIVFISPIAKYLLEKYDTKLIGREILTETVYLNPFTGYIHFQNTNILEFKSDSIFLSINDLSLKLSFRKLLTGKIEINSLILDSPRLMILQNDMKFNFRDLIEKFKKPVIDTNQIKTKTKFSITHIEIINGEFHFKENTIPVNYFIKKFNFQSEGKTWDKDTIKGTFSFVPGIGTGKVNCSFSLNLATLAYDTKIQISQLDLNIINQYLKELTNYGTFRATLDADLHANGNFEDQEEITLKGKLQANDFHFGKNEKDDYASFKYVNIQMVDVSPAKHKYLFDSVSVLQPYFKYERYENRDNLETMFGKHGSKIISVEGNSSHYNLILEIAKYVKILARNFFQSYYKINHLAIKEGNLEFNDFTLHEVFSTDLKPLSMQADSIDKDHQKVEVLFKSGIKPFGAATINLSINPKDSADFDMVYSFEKIPASMFNPYTISYTSFPLDHGTIEVKGNWNVVNGIIKSDNHLILLDPRVTKKIKNKDTNWLPLPLIMSFVRDYGNAIDYEIPITGNLKNPSFHLGDVFVDLFKNIFIKPATTTYRIKVKETEKEIEKSLMLQWQMMEAELRPEGKHFVEKISNYLSDNPEYKIIIYPHIYEKKEKEYLLYYEAKKKYYLSSKDIKTSLFSLKDSENVNKINTKDPAFQKFLDSNTNDSLLFTIYDKCYRLIGSKKIEAEYKKLNKKREDNFSSYFSSKETLKQVIIKPIENAIPYSGFSFYKIDYQNELPKSLLKAYEKINELNRSEPRAKYGDRNTPKKNELPVK